jgi:N-methylhydantoinase A
MGIQIGIDIGGTFTDFVVLHEGTGSIRGFKTPTVPAGPEAGIVHGLETLAGEGVAGEEITYFVHGTTIATNTLVQRSGVPLALIVTEGFRDVLEIARIRLPNPFDFNSSRARPLVPRRLVFPVRERVRADGSVETPLDISGARDVARRVRDAHVDGVVVCLLNSYRNGVHERQLKELIRELAPALYVSCSSEVWPEMREYERTLVTVINAYVRPQVVGYLDRLAAELNKARVGARPYVTKSNAGIMSLPTAAQAPVEMLLSGPAAGVVGATYVARLAGQVRLITFDVGGTSADVAVVSEGEPEYSKDAHIGDFPVMIPVVGVSSVGAGGGSIAWSDRTGVLHVGPRSAGADPGPACYGRGGQEPTLTDAFVVTGLLNPTTFCGGRIPLDPELARGAIARLGSQLGLSPSKTAEAIIEVATATTFVEFSSLLTRKGLDPRDFTLVAFGGAGPLLACRLAKEFHIGQVLVPLEPGTLCALGALMADVRNDYIKSAQVKLNEANVGQLRADYLTLRQRAEDWLAAEAIALADWRTECSGDMRYVGQAYELSVAVEDADLDDPALSKLRQRFHAEHHRVYGHADEGAAVEIVNARVRLIGRRERPNLRTVAASTEHAKPARTQSIHIAGETWEAQVYRRADLCAGHKLGGPAIVEQPDTTVFVPAAFRAVVDRFGNLLIRRGE